ncbi:hypothetical protein CO662_33625 [Rhizobium anhuiense]|uniref:Uncharacterized protein n=1 Tax=Rhizobium anhuiense TaxID=1184720 RepID=A0A432NY06_9HYPH|nr:hypothetical protein [Rhizobium anhuiense]PDS34040.1 hypothetical protein CO665_32710 [Rhizobium anhuiense]PDS40821.1 hypothetical protein CO668_32280 [Rhizobium anhuiense]PDS47704.1 hypothetical protein CO662_33625 [Rhizobium anhuiense]PDS55554.1 hypothetical protein CO663_29940 [Rhizobium anhuiense]
MQRYQIQALENGRWSVIDHQTGKPIVDQQWSSERTRLEAQALADFRNGISAPPPQRISSRLQKLRRAWALLGRPRST